MKKALQQLSVKVITNKGILKEVIDVPYLPMFATTNGLQLSQDENNCDKFLINCNSYNTNLGSLVITISARLAEGDTVRADAIFKEEYSYSQLVAPKES